MRCFTIYVSEAVGPAWGKLNLYNFIACDKLEPHGYGYSGLYGGMLMGKEGPDYDKRGYRIMNIHPPFYAVCNAALNMQYIVPVLCKPSETSSNAIVLVVVDEKRTGVVLNTKPIGDLSQNTSIGFMTMGDVYESICELRPGCGYRYEIGPDGGFSYFWDGHYLCVSDPLLSHTF